MPLTLPKMFYVYGAVACTVVYTDSHFSEAMEDVVYIENTYPSTPPQNSLVPA